MALRDRRLPELAIFVVAAVLHTWPLASAPATLGRIDNADTALNAWAIAWVGMAVITKPLHLFDANIFYPEPRTLAFSEVMLPQAIMGAPLTWLGWDPVLVYNLLVLAGFALSGWSMAWLVSQWTGDRVAGVVAGLAYAFNAHILVRFAHLQAMHVQYLPLALYALDMLLRRPSWRWSALVALACVLQALTSNYLLVMTVFAMAAAVAVRPESWRAPQLRSIAAAGVLSAIALAPFLYPYWLAHTQQGLERTFDDVMLYSGTWRDWLSTASNLHYDWWSHAWFAGSKSSNFPGVTVLLLSAAAMATGTAWRDPRARMALAIGIIGFVLSFGGHLPGYRQLFDLLPLLKGIRVVARFGWMTLFALPILAGFALAAWRRRLPPAAGLAVGVVAAVLVTAEATRAPMSFVVWDGIPRIYDRVAALDNAVLVEVPFPPRQTIYDNGPAMLFSAWHLKPLLNGYSGFTPASYEQHVEVMQAFPDADSLAALAAIGVTHVMVDARRVPPDVLERCVVSDGLALLADDGARRLYVLTAARP
ncbi:MAG: hypothetical protein IT178_02105 [Acidobacteria bacterium]|nr:hypothetical protein [Acidobacteriota bacterium]